MFCLKVVVFIFVLGFGVDGLLRAARHSGFEGPGGLKEFFSAVKPIVDFFNDLNDSQTSSLLKIITNQNLTKSQIEQQLDQWASQQSTKIQQDYATAKNQIQVFEQNITKLFDEKAANLSSGAKDVYNQLKTIYLNDGLTELQQCEQTQNVMKNVNDASIKKELKKAFGIFPTCWKVGKKDFDGLGSIFGRDSGESK
uniref:SXP/RAL-2 family protein Ani s 5-like cation-binding domain-containing protein n=1 Tax=Panagrolaimus sp. JU765 TaxID=591449 RepID=A0AC34RR28_9BILA